MHNIRLGHFQARSAAMRLSKTNYACRLPILSLSPFPKIRYKNLKFASDLYGLSTVTTIKITCALIAQLMVKSIILNDWLKKDRILQVTASLHAQSHNDSYLHQMVAVP